MTKAAAKTWAATKVPGGVDTLAKIWEDLRTRNEDGYVSMCGGLLALFKHKNGLPYPPNCKGTVCSPFVATVTGMAFDPSYPRKDLDGDPYVPMANEGKEELPFPGFYGIAKDDSPGAAIAYGLATKVDETAIRRGDIIGIDWTPKGGHAVFVWDVHLDANGKVDAFQFLSSNGSIKVGKGGAGVSIGGCGGSDWITGDCAETESITKKVKKKDPKTKEEKEVDVTSVQMKTRGNLAKAKTPLFDVSNDDIIKKGTWYAVPNNRPDFSTHEKKDAWHATFKVRPEKVVVSGNYSIAAMKCARLNYDGAPPAPHCMRDGAAPPPPKPGHTEAPAVLVKGDAIKSDPKAPQKVPPKPAKQEKDRVVDWQYFAEQALKVLFDKKWIKTAPGKTEDIHDANTQAALKEFQKLFALSLSGFLDKETVAELEKQLEAAQEHHETQKKLRDLHDGKKLSSDPRPIDGTNHAQTKSAVDEFQKKNALKPTGVPDAATRAKVADVHAASAATADAPGLSPHVKCLYWIGNFADVAGTATLRMHSSDLKVCELCDIHLIDEVSKTEVVATVQLNVDGDVSQVDVPMPPDFVKGALVDAKVVTQSAGEMTTVAPIRIGGTELADWRPYVDQDSVPDDLIDKIKRNRRIYPDKTASFRPLMYQHDKKGNVVLDKKTQQPVLVRFGGENHFDYTPPKSHKKWATDYAQKTHVDSAKDVIEQHVGKAWVQMLTNEGMPASFQTYDNQIVTWGVGFGGMGDGIYVFDEMNKDAKLARLLDDVGMNYGGGRYHVVDVVNKKVVSTPAKKRDAHYFPLDAVRQQMDLMSALVGMSEDPATRVTIAEAQWRVYKKNSTTWGGQDKVFGMPLYFLMTHMHHWLPAIANGVDVGALFATLGATTPTADTDAKLAQLVGNAFARTAKAKYARYYSDVWWRTRADPTHEHTLWNQYKADLARDGNTYPGDLVYDDDLEQPAKPPKW